MHTNDRGMKKWTTMMLPEHKEMLKEMWENEQQIERRPLDEQQFEQFNNDLSVAYAYKRIIHITYYDTNIDHASHTCKLTGKITKVHAEAKTIEVDGISIALEHVVNIEIVDDVRD